MIQSRVRWARGAAPFLDGRYPRAHEWLFDGGAVVRASFSPGVVPVPLSDPSAVDPEEALLAALSSCHMLWFLSLAAKAGFRVDSYEDAAEGVLGKDAGGRMAVTGVTLRPRIAFSGERIPDGEALAALHLEAHERCFIANSVRCPVRVDPPPGAGGSSAGASPR